MRNVFAPGPVLAAPPILAATLILAAALLAGCAVGPDYRAPKPDAPAAFSEARGDGTFDAAAEQRFWDGFNDPLLAELIRQTLSANRDLDVALARYQRASALLGGAQRDQLPSVTANAGTSRGHLASVQRTPPGSDDAHLETYQAGIAARWELDLFGRLRRASQARRAELGAAGADLNALRVALVGELASNYFQLRGLQQRLAVARCNVDNERQSLKIVQARLDAGRGTDFDVVRGRVQLERVKAAVPDLEAAVRSRMHRIAVLTGRQPTALVATLGQVRPLPAQVPVIPVGSPGDVLRRRPDIRAAERRLAAATADIGVASADLFPHFSLDGLIGSVAGDSGDLFTGAAESRHVTLGIDWTFLDYGKVRARIDAANADARAALAQYQQTVLEALEETETRLVRYHREQTRSEDLRLASESAGQAVDLARQRYRQGLIDYYQVLAAQRDSIDTRDQWIQSRTAVVVGMVDLYRSLAGAPNRGPAAPGADRFAPGRRRPGSAGVW